MFNFILFLIWSANVEPDLAGYRVSWGVMPGQYQYYIETVDTVVIAMPGRYYAVQAFDTGGNYSDYSREVIAMSDSIFVDESVRYRILSRDGCFLDSSKISIFWHPQTDTWPGSWSELSRMIDWKITYIDSIGITVVIFMSELSKYLDLSMSWRVQFRIYYEDVHLDTEIFRLSRRPCVPFKIERIPND